MKKTDSSTNPFSGKIYALILTIVILIIGTFFYFTAINSSAGMAIEPAKSMDASSQEKIISNDNSMPENNPKTPDNTGSEYPGESMDNEGSSEVKIQGSGSLLNHILQENKIFTKRSSDGSIKLFYYYIKDEPLEVQLLEGSINDYQIHTIGGQNYYPIILGAGEAKIMKEEGLFNNIGDPIKNFFGKNVVIVGIMNETGGVLDMAHLIPLNSGELN